MSFIKRKPKGALLNRRPVKLPSARPNSFQIVILSIRRRLADGPLGRFIRFATERHPYIVGEHGASCQIHPTANVANGIFNATSGHIIIKEYVLFGHGVNLLAGTHDASKTGAERQRAIPDSGYDIVIERGAWIATNVTIIGPCHIGENAVVASGSVVIGNVPANALIGGVPARVIKFLDLPISATSYDGSNSQTS